MTQSGLWIDEIVEAMVDLGGGGTLPEIYSKISTRNKIDYKSRPNWKSTVRHTILEYSSDANYFHKIGRTNEYDILYAPKGLHAGYWAIRENYRNSRVREAEREKSLIAESAEGIKVFYSYAHEDRILRDELEKHLSALREQGYITNWHDQEISAGIEWKNQIDKHLNSATIILLLISPDFMYSKYCYGTEMKKALERHELGEARVIPVILRPVDCEDAPFNKLQFLPTEGRPVTSWPNRDEAFLDITRGIRKAVYELLTEQWLDKGDLAYNQQHYEKALAAYEQAIRFDPDSPMANIRKGNVFFSFGNYKEALAVCEKAISLDPKVASMHSMKGDILFKLDRYEDALVAYEQALQLDPKSEFTYVSKSGILMLLKRYEEALATLEKAIKIATLARHDAYQGKGDALYKLERYKEALAAYKQAISLSANYSSAYKGKGDALCGLGHYEEALAAYEQAISLKANYSSAYKGKGDAYYKLERFKEALAAYEQAISLDSFNTDAYRGKGKVFQRFASRAFEEADLLGNQKSLN